MDTIKKYIYGQLAAGALRPGEAGGMLKELNKLQNRLREDDPAGRDIAVIGVAAEIGDTGDVDAFWQMLRSGRDGVRPLPPARVANVEEYLRVMGLTRDDVLIRDGAYLEAVDRFDSDFFKISAGEAVLMDPNQRIFLETAYKALEDAGYGGDQLAGTNTGLFVGFVHDFGDSYKRLIRDYAPGMLPMATLGNINSVIAGRLAYLLDLRGMSMLVDTACSSSLVAVHLACQSIRNGDCDLAVAGGVKLWPIPAEPKAVGEFGGGNGPGIGIEASDGRCRTFDDHSTGAGFGEGAVAMLLKPLQKALDDGDSIHAVIKGTAANQDGRSIGISAPNVAAQEEVIQKAWKDAKIEPETISYIEAHGTGTRLGDPIEVYAIQNSFAKYTRKRHFCGIGSVKTNVGHLDNAAGIAGLLKIVLAMRHRELPPSLHFVRPNREIDLLRSPVYVTDRLTPWETDGPRRAGVSSFGLSGTNCHIVLEEAPSPTEASSPTEAPPSLPLQLFVLSAKSEASLGKIMRRYLRFLGEQPGEQLTDLCYTAGIGRGHYQHRLALVVRDLAELREKLETALQGDRLPAQTEPQGIFRAAVSAVLARPSADSRHGNAVPASKDETSAHLAEKTLKAVSTIRERMTAVRGAAPDARMGELSPMMTNDGKSSSELHRLFCELAQLYISGADIDWKTLYQGIHCRRLHLPTYEFDRKRYWVKPVHFASPKTAAEEEQYFERVWQAEALTVRSAAPGSILVFTCANPIGTALVNCLLRKGFHVIEVSRGDAYRQLSEHRFVISGGEEDFPGLLREPALRDVSQILYLWSFGRQAELSAVEELTGWRETVLFGFFHLAKALQKRKGAEVEVVVVSDPACPISGREERLYPENAALFGLGKVVNQECPGIHCRCIELEIHSGTAARGGGEYASPHAEEPNAETVREAADILLHELQAVHPAYLVAYRGTARYIEELRPVAVLPQGEPVSFEQEGVYLITGGAGGIGLEIGKALARHEGIHLALLGRTPLPPREQWDEWIASNPDSREAKKIAGMQAMETLGAQVEYISADLADFAAMRSVTTALRGRYGRICGLVHAAGVAGDGILLQKTDGDFRAVLAPKMDGTWILEHLTREDRLDFCILFSSVSGLFGGPGQGDYTAANSYLDAYAAYWRRTGVRTMAIQWTAWEETGMAVDYQVQFDRLIFRPIRTDEAIAQFQRLLNSDVTGLLIGKIHYPRFIEVLDDLPVRLHPDLRRRLEERRNRQGEEGLFRSAASNVTVREDVGEVEKRVAAIWANILGLSEVSVYDNFYELGGDSIIALTLVNELQKAYPGTVDAADLFSRPTIRGISDLIREKLTPVAEAAPAEEDEDETLLAILDQLERGSLSFEEGLEMIHDLEEST